MKESKGDTKGIKKTVREILKMPNGSLTDCAKPLKEFLS
jgi:hypothetical protein